MYAQAQLVLLLNFETSVVHTIFGLGSNESPNSTSRPAKHAPLELS